MTQEEKRIKLAEAAGWHEKPEPHGSHNATAWWHNQDRYPSYLMPVPDYFNDLNAVHEAEKMLTDIQWIGYAQHLEEVSMQGGGEGNFSPSRWIHATATQRCEALGLTLNLWKA